MSLVRRAGENKQQPGYSETDDQETAGQIIAASKKMVASVGIVEADLHSANREATAYNDALNAFGNGISPDNNAEMQALVARMLQQTQDMQQ